MIYNPVITAVLLSGLVSQGRYRRLILWSIHIIAGLGHFWIVNWLWNWNDFIYFDILCMYGVFVTLLLFPGRVVYRLILRLDRQKRIVIYTAGFFLLLLAIDYSPLLIYRVLCYQRSPDLVYFYRDYSCQELQSKVGMCSNDSIEVEFHRDTSHWYAKNHYLYLTVHDKIKQEYYNGVIAYEWYDPTFADIQVGYIGQTKDINYQEDRHMVLDCDLINAKRYKKRFEELIIDRIPFRIEKFASASHTDSRNTSGKNPK